MIWRGRMPLRSRSITSVPLSKAISALRGSTAGTPLKPMGDTPSISKAVAMVLAVNWPPHAPAPGQAWPSISLSSRASILPGVVGADRLEDVLDGEPPAPVLAEEDGAAVEHQARQIEARHGHHHGGDGLVAARRW